MPCRVQEQRIHNAPDSYHAWCKRVLYAKVLYIVYNLVNQFAAT